MMSVNPYQGAASSGTIDCLVPPPQSSSAGKPKRIVSFRPTVTVHPIEKLSSNQESKSRLYLSEEDLSAIAINNKVTLTPSKKTRDCDAMYHCAEHGTSGLQADPALRGLEQSLCSTRAQNRLIIRRTIINYHRKLNANPAKSDEEKLSSLAAASSKLSQWSLLIALEAARHDLRQACTEDDLILTNTPGDTSLSSAAKRRRVTCDE